MCRRHSDSAGQAGQELRGGHVWGAGVRVRRGAGLSPALQPGECGPGGPEPAGRHGHCVGAAPTVPPQDRISQGQRDTRSVE